MYHILLTLCDTPLDTRTAIPIWADVQQESETTLYEQDFYISKKLTRAN